MKIIGMIGGVSWESTALYYQLINELVRHELGGLNSAKLLISSLNYQELVDYKNNNDWAALAAILAQTAKTLEQAGAESIVLCCNTLHKVADAITSSIAIPFLHIIDAAGFALSQANVSKVGLLGTQFTMEDGFYHKHLMNQFNIEVMTPALEAMRKIDAIIYQELCVGKVLEQSKKLLQQTIQTMTQQGAQAILLGCTELGLIIQPADCQLPLFDTTNLHAKAIVSFALSGKPLINQ